MYRAGSYARPLLFLAQKLPGDHVIREDINVVVARFDHSFSYAVETLAIKPSAAFALGIVLVPGWNERRAEAVSTFECPLQHRCGDRCPDGDIVLSSVLAIISLGEDNVAAVDGEALPPTPHPPIKFSEALVSEPFDANVVFNCCDVDLARHERAESVEQSAFGTEVEVAARQKQHVFRAASFKSQPNCFCWIGLRGGQRVLWSAP